MFTLGRGLRKFFAASSTTMESLPLKELDFGLQKRTGPSSGVVASIVLVSPGLDCPGVSLAEVCATCLGVTCGSLVIEVQYLELDFHEPGENCKKSISHAQHTIFISTECPFHTPHFGNEKKKNHNL